MTIIRFQGTVVQEGSTHPIAGLTVEAFDLDETISGALGQATTGEEGEFNLELRVEALDRMFGEKPPRLYFRVRSKTDVLLSTESSLVWLARSSQSGRLELPTDIERSRTRTYVVEGRVAFAASGPIAAATVTVFRRTLTVGGISETRVASTTTGRDGRYLASFALADDLRPSLRIEALTPKTGKILAERVVEGASLRQVVDLTDDGGTAAPSGYDALERRLEPHAFVETPSGKQEIAWTPEQIALVTHAAGEDARSIQRFVDAKTLHERVKGTSREVYFGLLAAGLPASPGKLFARGRSGFRSALEAAIANRTLPRGIDIETTLRELENAAVEQLMLTTHSEIVPIGALVSLTSGETVPESARKAFVRHTVELDGVSDATWAAAESNPVIGKAHTAELKLRVGLADFVRDHRPMIAALRAVPGLTSEKDVAKLTRAEIRKLVEGANYPEGTEGADEKAKRDNYARAIADRIERKYRTEFHKKTFAVGTAERSFFDSNESFDFVKTRVAQHLAEHPNALDKVPAADRPAVLARLKEEERLFHFTDYSHEVVALRGAAFGSAYAVVKDGRQRFRQRMEAAGLSEAKVDDLYDRAYHRTAVATVALAKWGSVTGGDVYKGGYTHSPFPSTVPSVTLPKLAEWQALFGTLDACKCEHCMSVLSPAAYLVDLLQFLRRLDGPGTKTGHDVFFARRPDIQYILLDCPSSLTPMPMIDLVNEIMEVRLALDVGDGDFPSDWPKKTIATKGTAEELAAMPDPVYNSGGQPKAFLRNRAYAHLRQRVFPFDAPYSLWSDEAATYLAALGMPRHELCRILAPRTTPGDQIPADELETMFRLGLSRGAYNIIVGASTAETRSLWGMPSDPPWLTSLRNARTFLLKSGLSYDEVRELMATQWAEAANVELVGETCELDQLSINGLSEPEAKYLHRLLRLRRRTKLSLTEIDRARPALIGTLDVDSLRKFAIALELCERLDVSWSTALVWWGPIDTRSAWTPSPFDKLFLDKSVRNPNDTEFEVLVGTPGGRSVLLQNVIPGLLIGTRLREQDLRLLLPIDDAEAEAPVDTIASLGIPAVLHSRRTLRLANVSRLLRHATFARALRMPLAELLILRALSGAKPLAGDAGHAGPEDTRAFVELVDRVRSGPLSIADIDYLLRDRRYPGLHPSETAPWISEIDAALIQIHASSVGLEDPTGTRAQTLLEQLFRTKNADGAEVADGAVVAAIMAAIAQSETDAAPQDWETNLRRLSPYLDDLEAAVRELLGASPLPKEERFSFVAQRLERYVVSRAFVRMWAARTFSIPVDTAIFLLERRLTWRREGSAESQPAMFAFLPGGNVRAANSDADPARPVALELELGSALEADKLSYLLRRLHKSALLINRLKLNLEQVAFMFRDEELGELPLLDLNALRVVEETPSASMPTAEFDALLRIVDIIGLGARLPGGSMALNEFISREPPPKPKKEEGIPSGSLPELLRNFTVGKGHPSAPHPFPRPGDPRASFGPQPTFSEALTQLSEMTGWLREDLAKLAQRMGFTTRARLCDSDALLRLERAMRTLTLLGARAEAAISWVKVSEDDDWTEEEKTARDIIHHLRARFEDDDAWLSVARPLRDSLRERQRDALTSALLRRLGKEKPAELYANLLIDVEVASAPMTSRIVQASAAVQLFLQRVLLRLENGVSADSKVAASWKWMKNYRVWEANRRVFLYPENYLVPELRDDKTPLFDDLETYLLQGPMTDKRAEEAYLRYLAGLEEIANLKPVALCKDENGTLHMLGETETPKRHFYRTRASGRWTPWQRVDLDLEGEHFALAAGGGRVYLVWLHIEEITSRYQERGLDKPVLLENRVRVSYSELVDGRWSKKATTEPFELGARLPPRYFRLGALFDGGVLYADLSVRKNLVYAGDGVFWRMVAWQIDPFRRTSIVAAWAPPFENSARYVATSDLPIFEHIPDAPKTTFEAVEDRQLRQEMLPGGQRDLAWSTTLLPWDSSGFPHFPTTDLQLSFEDLSTIQVFRNIAWTGRFAVLAPSSRLQDQGPRRLIAFEDPSRSLLIEVSGVVDRGSGRSLTSGATVSFDGGLAQPSSCTLLTHPHAATFRNAVALGGLDGLLKWDAHYPHLQLRSDPIKDWYQPNEAIFDLSKQPFPKEDVDFRLGAPFSSYNWELFFHIPMMMATRLARVRRHEEALRWFHFMFDPADGSLESAPKRYWKVKPFYELRDFDDIAEELQGLAQDQLPASGSMNEVMQLIDDTDGSRELGAQIHEWLADPFDPFAIARFRHLAYMKWVVQSYVQNLLDWGDQLFSQDTLETVNEATQLYVHALNILGPRPVFVDPPKARPSRTYKQLEDDGLDNFSNALIGAESFGGWKFGHIGDGVDHLGSFGSSSVGGQLHTISSRSGGQDFANGSAGRPGTYAKGDSFGDLEVDAVLSTASIWRRLYFCVPPNEKLLGMWDLVEDRLFKIRHSLNIEGIARTLPLFAPPIDPALLVAATAAGLDLSTVVGDLNSAAPFFRFSVLLAKASEFTSGLISLGQSLLSAMEKRDGEELSLLRQSHEIAVQQATRLTRKEQVREAQANIDALTQSKEPVQTRLDFYASRTEVFEDEERALKRGTDGHEKLQTAGDMNFAAKAAAMSPDGTVGIAGTGSASWVTVGGSLAAKKIEAVAAQVELGGSRLVFESGNLATRAGYRRRFEDWNREEAALKQELANIDKQIVAAEIRLAIAEHELETVEKQIDQSREVDDLLKSKFTNKQLYDWMVGQTAAVYFQAYQLAYDMAKKAEKAFRVERGDDTSPAIITFGYWDGIHQGLLAGERLAVDLRRLDAAYLAQNKREYELTKNVSLVQHDPIQLLRLRQTGSASFTITEADYDRDHPTHYLRRLKTAAVTIPCVTGPTQGVAGRLTLFRGQTRPTATATELKNSVAVLQSIVTSSAQNDGGLFELNLKDERLLPFEGVGAHAEAVGMQPQWRFEISPGADFDRTSIDDLVLHLRYTARDGRLGGDPYAAKRWRMIRLRTEMAEAWNAFQEGDANAIEFTLSKHHFAAPPGSDFELLSIKLAYTKIDGVDATLATPLEVVQLGERDGDITGLRVLGVEPGALRLEAAAGLWSVGFGSWSGDRAALRDVWLLVQYGSSSDE